MSTNLTVSRQRAIRSQINHLAWLLDNSITIPFIGYRIGIEAIIGLIPVVGDAVGMLLSSYTELRHKLTFCTRVKMLICAAAEYTL